MTYQQALEMQIEVRVEKMTDRIDRRYMSGELTTEQYRVEMQAISEWADQAYLTVTRV